MDNNIRQNDKPVICCRCDHWYDELASRWLCPRCGEHNPCCDGAPQPDRP